MLKATVDTSSGRDVKILRLVNGVDEKSQRKISEDFDDMGKNFVLQERVKPHHSFAAIYPYAINTLRVVTYLVDAQICVAPIILRIGRGENQVDNAHAGGMFIGVKDDGTLNKEAYTEYQKDILFIRIQVLCLKVICCPIFRKLKIQLKSYISKYQWCVLSVGILL